MFRDVPRCSKMFRDVPRCSKMFLIVLNRLPRLLDLRQRADPVIVFGNVRIVNGAIMLRHGSRGIPKGARKPLLVVSNREGPGRGRNPKSSPPWCHFLCLFLLDKAKERGIISPPAHGKELDLILGKDEVRSCWAVFVCILFSLAGDRENRIEVSPSF